MKRHLLLKLGLSLAPVLLIFMVLIILITALSALFTSSAEAPAMVVTNLPEEVLKWRPLIIRQMEAQGLDLKWIDVLLAQMMQESGGRVVDLFQCSESKYGVPGLINSEEESIEQAVYYWTVLIDRAEELGIAPTRENLLQSYNMGIGYLDHLSAHGSDTTEELASMFSVEVLHGGGDPKYVAHVLRYLQQTITTSEAHVIRTQKYYLTEGFLFGPRTSPIPGRDFTFHSGIDLPAPTGTPVYSAIEGIAYNHYDPSLGGIQVNVIAGNVMTMYAHLSASNVQHGQPVDQNTIIGLVGSTGASTGPHLHFGWYINNKAVDPVPFLSPEQFTEAFLRDYGR